MTELKEKYPHIRRIAYLCKHESGCLVGAGTSLRKQIKEIAGCDSYVAEYEEIKKSDRINSARRASYIERNQLMIRDSDFAIFYLNKKLDGNSGTSQAFRYAQSRGVKILQINSP